MAFHTEEIISYIYSTKETDVSSSLKEIGLHFQSIKWKKTIIQICYFVSMTTRRNLWFQYQNGQS